MLVDDRALDLLAGAERAVHDGAGADVVERRADERAALARLDVLELDDLEEAFVEVERHAVLKSVVVMAAMGTSGLSGRAAQTTSATWGTGSADVPLLGDEHRVLDAHPAEAGRYTPGSTVTTSTGGELPGPPGRGRAPRGCRARPRGRCRGAAVLEAAAASDVAARPVDLVAGGTGRTAAAPAAWASVTASTSAALLTRGLADRRGCGSCRSGSRRRAPRSRGRRGRPDCTAR